MAKKRKTRQQKLQSDKRHTVMQHQTTPVVLSPRSESRYETPVTATATPLTVKPTKHAISTSEYQFVRHDLLKTSTITGAIIVAELVLFFVLR
jgi:hypothetical protein